MFANLQSICRTATKLGRHRVAVFHSSSARPNYEGDGKTTMTCIEDEVGKHLLVTSYNEKGFSLSNGARITGPCILFPNIVFQWKVNSIEEISEESLSMFRILHPRLDVLFLGVGEIEKCSPEAVKSLRKVVLQLGLNAEIMPTRTAVSTYNFALSDFRVVAGAFLPTRSIQEYRVLEAVKTEKSFTYLGPS